MSIDELRRDIDDIDEQIVQLLNKRARCALQVGRFKKEAGLDIYQPDRERDVLEHVRRRNGGPLDDGAVTRLFERIIDENRRLERVVHEGAPRRPAASEPN
ncbi:MAG: chorismate mutase [Luteitalea sp.]|nr:chorismate mutase [Luteitalea sp.]